MLTAQGSSIDVAVTLGARQQQALDLLRGAPDGIALAISPTRTSRRRRSRGWRRSGSSRSSGAASSAIRSTASRPHRADAGRQLTGEQAAALDAARARSPTRATFRVALLHGVTGSGKTEIYLRLARARPRSRAAAC